MKTITNAQIHRFRDLVAIYLQNGATVYLTPLQAQQIADALTKCALDVVHTDFVNSKFKTFTITGEVG